LVQLQEEIGARSGETNHGKVTHQRLKQMRDLLRFSRFRPSPDVVHEWFEQQLVEAVMSVMALRRTGAWSIQELEDLWSEAALTAAVLPRWHIDVQIKRALGAKFGKLKVA
jgi:hypothetical protein